MNGYTVLPVTGLGEVTEGMDLAGAVLDLVDLEDGDVLVVTSKVVSKAEGRVVAVPKEQALLAETDRVVARRGPTVVVRTRHGLVMAAAGIDASNTRPGTLVLLPEDPDRSARGIRSAVHARRGVSVAVVVSDTSGRAWRTGQTDIAIGAAGLDVIDDHAGRVDDYGNQLAVTAPALADEIAGAGDLAKGKLAMTPVAVVRGLGHLVHPHGQDGPGARVLVRDEASDMFGLGAREAVLQAVAGDDLRGFGAPAGREVVVEALLQVGGGEAELEPAVGAVVVVLLPPGADPRRVGRLEARLEAVARAHGWTRDPQEQAERLTLRPAHP